MRNHELKLFADASILSRVPRTLLAEFFARFTRLLPNKYALPNPRPDNDSYHRSLAAVIERPGALPAPLLQALADVEALAAPENHPLPEPPPGVAPGWIMRAFQAHVSRCWSALPREGL